jgi:hypothetical protein
MPPAPTHRTTTLPSCFETYPSSRRAMCHPGGGLPVHETHLRPAEFPHSRLWQRIATTGCQQTLQTHTRASEESNKEIPMFGAPCASHPYMRGRQTQQGLNFSDSARRPGAARRVGSVGWGTQGPQRGAVRAAPGALNAMTTVVRAVLTERYPQALPTLWRSLPGMTHNKPDTARHSNAGTMYGWHSVSNQ